MRMWMRSVVLAVVVVGLTGCGDDGPTEVEGLDTVDGAPEVRVEGIDFAFEPDALELTASEPANIVFEVTDGGHNLVVPDANFQLPIIDEGEVTRGALRIDEPGTYDMVCTVPGHIDEGMVATIEVS
jgi:plastocyanin